MSVLKPFLYFLILLPFSANSQWEHPDLEMGFQWKYFEDSTLTEKDKAKLLSKISVTGHGYVRALDAKENVEFGKNCHFFDFGGDSLTDVIFTGLYPGISRNCVIFFINTPDGLEAVMRLHGELRLLSKLHGRFKGIRFTVLKKAIDQSIVNEMTTWYFEKDMENITVFYPDQSDAKAMLTGEFCAPRGAKEIRRYIYIRNVQFPEEAGTKSLRTFSDSTWLMQKPKPVENTDFDQTSGYFLKQDPLENKAIALVRPNTNCVAIGYEILDNVPYFLVIVPNAELISSYLPGLPGFQLGWISGRHVVGDSSRSR